MMETSELILSILRESPNLSFKQLIPKVRKSKKISPQAVHKCLKKMVKNGELKKSVKKVWVERKAKVYELV